MYRIKDHNNIIVALQISDLMSIKGSDLLTNAKYLFSMQLIIHHVYMHYQTL